MTCRDVVEYLMAYLAGELPAAEKARFQEHMDVCPPCVHYLHSYQETVRLGRAACQGDEEDVPEDLVRAILAARRNP